MLLIFFFNRYLENIFKNVCGAYGFRIDETDDNCGGFYHCDYDAMIEEAKDCVDAFWDEKIKAFFKRKKQEIRNRIPFDKRTVYNLA